MKTTQNIFKTFENQELFYRIQEHDVPSNSKILILLHRGHEHSARLEIIALKKEEDVFLVANSVAGVVASTWVHDYAPTLAGMALVAPAFKIKLYFPFVKDLLKMVVMLKPKLNIKSYVKSKPKNEMSTHIEFTQREHDKIAYGSLPLNDQILCLKA